MHARNRNRTTRAHRPRPASVVVALVALLVSTTTVAAQPATQAAPVKPAPPAQPEPDEVQPLPALRPAPVGAAPQGPQQPVLEEPRFQPQGLRPWERDLLERGPISGGAWVGGGILGSWIGFGVGHAVQGRWAESGVLFTVGEALSLSLLVTGVVNASEAERFTCTVDSQGQEFCTQSGSRTSTDLWAGMAVASGIVFGVLRIWEIVDVWSGPARHNAEYYRVRNKAAAWGFSLTPVPTRNGGNLVATLRF